MRLFELVKTSLNVVLDPFNICVGSRTAERREKDRLGVLVTSNHFAEPAFPVPAQFTSCDPQPVLTAVEQFRKELARFTRPQRADEFSLENAYYTSPDAEVLYAMVRLHKPRCIIEVGSGNSTLLFRQAINDGGLNTKLTSIDPNPRRQVEHHADEVIRARLETLYPQEISLRLQANDFLFVDSSHEIKTGNDVVTLFLTILPTLVPGVIIHLHDIFLPFDYPKEWIVDFGWGWNEQYLLQAMLQGGNEFEVLWAGHHFERSLSDFGKHFPLWRGEAAKSVWLRRAGRVA